MVIQEVKQVPITVTDITGRVLKDVTNTEKIKHRVILTIDQTIDQEDVHGIRKKHHQTNYELAYEYEVASRSGDKIRTGRDELYFGQQREPITFGAYCRIVRPFEKDGEEYKTDDPIHVINGKFVFPRIVEGEKAIPVGLIEPFFVEAWKSDDKFKIREVQEALISYIREYTPTENKFT